MPGREPLDGELTTCPAPRALTFLKRPVGTRASRSITITRTMPRPGRARPDDGRGVGDVTGGDAGRERRRARGRGEQRARGGRRGGGGVACSPRLLPWRRNTFYVSPSRPARRRQHVPGSQRTKRRLVGCQEARRVQLLLAAVAPRYASLDGRRAPADAARLVRQPPLRERERVGRRRAAEGGRRQRLGLRVVARQHGERAPQQREGVVAVQAPAEQLQVVRRHRQRADRDEHQQPRPELADAGDAEGDGAREAGDGQAAQRAARDGGAQRPAVQLVQAVRRDADGQAERRHRRDQPAGVERRARGRLRSPRRRGARPCTAGAGA